MEPVAKRGRSEMWDHFSLISPNKVCENWLIFLLLIFWTGPIIFLVCLTIHKL